MYWLLTLGISRAGFVSAAAISGELVMTRRVAAVGPVRQVSGVLLGLRAIEMERLKIAVAADGANAANAIGERVKFGDEVHIIPSRPHMKKPGHLSVPGAT